MCSADWQQCISIADGNCWSWFRFSSLWLLSHCSGQLHYRPLKCLCQPLSSLWLPAEVKDLSLYCIFGSSKEVSAEAIRLTQSVVLPQTDLSECLSRPRLLHQHEVVRSVVQSQECEFPLTLPWLANNWCIPFVVIEDPWSSPGRWTLQVKPAFPYCFVKSSLREPRLLLRSAPAAPLFLIPHAQGRV